MSDRKICKVCISIFYVAAALWFDSCVHEHEFLRPVLGTKCTHAHSKVKENQKIGGSLPTTS